MLGASKGVLHMPGFEPGSTANSRSSAEQAWKAVHRYFCAIPRLWRVPHS